MALRRRRQHPPILANPALLQRGLQGVQPGRDPRQPTWHYAVALILSHYEATQHHRTRGQPTILQHWGGGQRRRRLGDKQMRCGPNPFTDLATGSGIELTTFPIRTAWQDRAHHQFVQMSQNIVAICRMPAPPGRQRWQFKVFTQQLPTQQRQKRRQRRIFNQTAADGVGQGDMAAAHRLEQTGNTEQRIAA